ncbi:hypothetical protein [Sulfurimonas sp.]|uniref:hypothetical protein n=1 Tax=Sulfurimonas sp. TaxID=2022749 RepID=UPI0025EF51ED|nr:hypothetical protein [Sulfurimonas sp.]
MYKKILLFIIITIFIGCSSQPKHMPRPTVAPLWYANPPKDDKNFYVTASSNNLKILKKIAINNLRNSIAQEIKTSFKTPKHILKPTIDMQEKINNAIDHLSKTIAMGNVKTINSKFFKNKHLILIAISKKDLYLNLEDDIKDKISKLEDSYNKNKNTTDIQRYLHLEPLMSQYEYLASRIALSEICSPSDKTKNNFKLLQNLQYEYHSLKSDINFYILSDYNSRLYSKVIISALKKDGLHISKTSKDSHTLKLLMSSKTENTFDYSFNKSKTRIVFTTFDVNGKKVLYRQHTFIGKSRKSHKDAKMQTFQHMKSKVRQLGILNFIGVKSN